MTKETIRVFPDYMSSGLWLTTGANIDVEYLENAVHPYLLLTLKYWHAAWEYGNIDCKSTTYRQQWNTDGQFLVDSMNTCQTQFNFVYVESL